jgi:hypothetical protein
MLSGNVGKRCGRKLRKISDKGGEPDRLPSCCALRATTRFSYSRMASATVYIVPGLSLPILISCSLAIAQATASALLLNVSDKLMPLRRTCARHKLPRFVYVANPASLVQIAVQFGCKQGQKRLGLAPAWHIFGNQNVPRRAFTGLGLLGCSLSQLQRELVPGPHTLNRLRKLINPLIFMT